MSQFDVGYRAMQETITADGDPATLLTELSAHTPETVELFAGAVSAVLQAYASLRAAGLPTKHADAEVNKFLQSPPAVMALTLQRNLSAHAKGESTRVAFQLNAICTHVTAHRAKISFGTPVVKAEAPSPIEVHVVNMPAPSTEPQGVHILTMPTRTTVSEIERDRHGNIVSATKTEHDAA